MSSPNSNSHQDEGETKLKSVSDSSSRELKHELKLQGIPTEEPFLEKKELEEAVHKAREEGHPRQRAKTNPSHSHPPTKKLKKISKMRPSEMKEELRSCGISTDGLNKKQLVEALKEARTAETTTKESTGTTDNPQPLPPTPHSRADADAIAEWIAKRPVAGKTTDPMASQYDQARYFYASGVQMFREGRIENAAVATMGAIVQNEKAVQFCRNGGSNDALLSVGEILALCKVGKGTKKSVEMANPVLLYYLMRYTQTETLYDTSIEMGLPDIARSGLICTMERFEVYEKNPNDASVTLLGNITRARAKLHYFSAHLFMMTKNGSAADTEFEKSLALDPSFAEAKLDRALFWLNTRSKSNTKIYAELMSIVDQVHEDFMQLDLVYALLCTVLLSGPHEGAFSEMIHCYKESVKASARCAELYGSRVLDPRASKLRENLQPLVQKYTQKSKKMGSAQADCFPGVPVSKSNRNCCIVCEVNGKEKQLLECTRCRMVSYCSKECQKKHWPKHKPHCHAASKVNAGTVTSQK